jgi:hypothetical protein
MQEVMPRFVIELRAKAKLSGPGTTTEFPELQSFLQSCYEVVEERGGYAIWELRRQ